MRILILETGAPPAALQARHGDYAKMLRTKISAEAPGLSFASVRIFEGAPPPPPSDIDGVLITGSPAGVYDGHDWIAPLEDYIRAAAALRRPMVGVCFGHQIMAQAFGGRVEKSGRGWGVGVHEYDVRIGAPWMDPAARKIACAVSHQDQVIAPPPAARVLAGSDFCPNGVIAYDHAPAISFQMHPEFEADYARDLLRARRGRLSAELIDEGFSSLAAPTDRALIARWIGGFYRSAYGV